MEIKGSNRELEALLVAIVIAHSIVRADPSEEAEVDMGILLKWQKTISESLVVNAEE